MTELELRKKYIATIEAWIGMSKAAQTHHVIIDTYNKIRPLPRGYKLSYYDAYCCATVSAAAYLCGLLDIMPPACDTGNLISGFKAIGRWVENDAYVPTIGDWIIYYWDDNGIGDCSEHSSHVGAVVGVNNGNIRVIEGNKGSSGVVGYREIAVNGRYIRGFCCPDYASKATDKDDEIIIIEEAVANSGRTSERCLDFIKRCEGFVQYAMWDYAQYSIGYGCHCKQNEYPNGITREQADALLRKYIKEDFEPAIAKLESKRGKPFLQCEWDALVSFSFNVGTAWTTNSSYSIYKYAVGEYAMNADDFTTTMKAWSKAGGQTLSGLVKRREAEAKMYLDGNYDDGKPNQKEGGNKMTLTKAELEKMIDDRVNAALRGANSKPSDWAKKELQKAVNAGITDGTRPGGYAKREEVAAMIVRAIK